MEATLDTKIGTKVQKKRDYAVDILKIFCIFLIMFAHTSIKYDDGGLLFNLRNFDVVTLVFLSGVSFTYSYKKITTFKEYRSYVWKRIKRLLFPTYIYFILYIIFMLILSPWYDSIYLDIPRILGGFILIDTVLYVWITRIYLFLSLLGPLYNLILSKIPLIEHKLCFASIFLFSSFVLIFFLKTPNETFNGILNTYILNTVSYSGIYIMGMIYKDLRKSDKLTLFLILITLNIYFIYMFGFDVQAFKYPPTLLYMTYGLFMSTFLYEFIKFLTKKISKLPNFIITLSKNTLVLYFIHTFYIYLFVDTTKCLSFSYYVEFIVILILSLITLYFGLMIKKYVLKKIKEVQSKRTV